MPELRLVVGPPGTITGERVTGCWSARAGDPGMEPMGSAALGPGHDLNFVVCESTQGDASASASLTLPAGQYLLRIDEVVFPQKAVAYRHVHPGPGIRYLLEGSLRLVADDHRQDVNIGDAWFEDANSPVRAENTAQSRTRFVRAMILPTTLKGRPSINILSPEDRAKPRLQVTHRHIDHLFTL